MKASCKKYWEYRKEEIFRIFRRGFRVLAVDDDRVCSRVLEKMLIGCLYHVTIKDCAKDALSLLREQKNEFDIVISDVHMPEMDGFSLLEHIALEIDLPVVMVSADDDKRAVMKGVTRGACDYLIKPVRIEALRNIWKHVLRKKRIDLLKFDRLSGISKRCHLTTNEAGNLLQGSSRNQKRKKDNEIRTREKGDNSCLKKRRVVWEGNLHNNFVSAVNKLGLQKAVPKKILELMSTPGLTRENVTSHLQKFRLYIRRLGEGNPVPRHPNALIIKPEEANLGSVDSPIGLQSPGTLFSTGEILAEELAIFEQRNPITFDSYGEEEEEVENHNFSNNEPTELLHGIPIRVEPRQFKNIRQSMQPFVNPNMQGNPCLSWNSGILTQATQQFSRPCCVVNGTSTSQVPRSIMFHDVDIMDPYINQSTRISLSNSFHEGSSSRISTHTSNGFCQNLVNREIKVPRGFGYDIFDELNQHKSKESFSCNQFLSYSASQHTMLPSVLVNQDSGGALNVPNISQPLNTSHVENVPESSYQEDLITALLNQQEDIESQGMGELEGDFGFMASSFDCLPM